MHHMIYIFVYIANEIVLHIQFHGQGLASKTIIHIISKHALRMKICIKLKELLYSMKVIYLQYKMSKCPR